MAEPLSDQARAVLEFVKAHPGVQLGNIASELHLDGKDLYKALVILQGRGFIFEKREPGFDKWSFANTGVLRFFPKI